MTIREVLQANRPPHPYSPLKKHPARLDDEFHGYAEVVLGKVSKDFAHRDRWLKAVQTLQGRGTDLHFRGHDGPGEAAMKRLVRDPEAYVSGAEAAESLREMARGLEEFKGYVKFSIQISYRSEEVQKAFARRRP